VFHRGSSGHAAKITNFHPSFSILSVIESRSQVNVQISGGMVKDVNLATNIPRFTLGVNNLYTFSFKK